MARGAGAGPGTGTCTCTVHWARNQGSRPYPRPLGPRLILARLQNLCEGRAPPARLVAGRVDVRCVYASARAHV